MPKGSDWTQFIYVNLGFVAQICAMYIFSSIAEIKQNWPLYRCNPMYMGLADDVNQNFVYCVQNMQTDFMGFLLQPLIYILSGLSDLGGTLADNMNLGRNMIGNIRGFFTTIIQSIFGVFVNLIIEFQKIIGGIKDLIGKVVGIMVTVMYIMDGSVKTMQSTWNGPPGEAVRTLSGACFHPDTEINLLSGRTIKMSDADNHLGEYLENGSRIVASMKINNSDKLHKLYKISCLNKTQQQHPQQQQQQRDIFVTGSHHILHAGKYILVKDCPFASIQHDIESTYFSCLITDDHNISVGPYTFWDWEDWLLPINHKT